MIGIPSDHLIHCGGIGSCPSIESVKPPSCNLKYINPSRSEKWTFLERFM